MKRLVLVVYLLQVMIIVVSGKMINDNLLPPTQYVDKETGLVVKADIPENTVASFYSLMEKGGYKAAFSLIADFSKKEVGSPGKLEYAESNFKLKSARLTKVFPAVVEKDLALVGFIRLNKFDTETESALVGIEVLIKQENTWHIVKSSTTEEQFKRIMELALKTDKLLVKQKVDEFTEFQQAQIFKQIKAMEAFHNMALEDIKSLEEQEKNLKEKKDSVRKKVYEQVYGQDDH